MDTTACDTAGDDSAGLLEKSPEVTIVLYPATSSLSGPFGGGSGRGGTRGMRGGGHWNDGRMKWRGGGQGDNLIRHREGLPWRRYKTQSLD